jgi:hypothetical protein
VVERFLRLAPQVAATRDSLGRHVENFGAMLQLGCMRILLNR